MVVTTLHELFIHELQDIASYEKQIVEALPAMIAKTLNSELKEAFSMHLEETKKQSDKILELCKAMEIDPQGKDCAAMAGIITEGKEIITANEPSDILDLAMISVAQKVEHYEIASYSTAANYAQEMGHTEALELLRGTLDEEKMTDEKLTAMAENLIPKAPSGME